MRARSLLFLVVAILAVGILALWYSHERQEYRLAIAAGQPSGQAFQLIKAIQTVAKRHYPELKIEVFETRGSLHNARLLVNGTVDLATTQSDLVMGSRAQLIAALYSDAFQLIVHNNRGIRSLADLAGKRVALPPKGSNEYNAFLFLADHYNLPRSKLEIFPGTEATTDWLFIDGDVDAVFRMRAPGDASVLNLIEKVDSRILPIPQAAALRLKQPSLQVGLIPKGSYNGRPVVPDKDLETVSVQRLLLASSKTPESVIVKLTSVLFERRRELIDILPLAGSITMPDRSSGTFLPVHSGAQSFYDRHEPTFLQENAEPITLMVTVLVILTSAYLQLSVRRRKRVLDGYNNELLSLADTARSAKTFKQLDGCDTKLAGFVSRIVASAEGGQINSSEFNLFQFTYEAVEDAIRDREQQLERAYREEHGEANAPPRRRGTDKRRRR